MQLFRRGDSAPAEEKPMEENGGGDGLVDGVGLEVKGPFKKQ
jgi:hypothetical protein